MLLITQNTQNSSVTVGKSVLNRQPLTLRWNWQKPRTDQQDSTLMEKEFLKGKRVLIMGLGRFGGGLDSAFFAAKAKATAYHPITPNG